MTTVSMKAAITMAALFSAAPLLAASSGSIEERLDRLERADNSRNLIQIDMQQQLDVLGNEVRQLRGALEEANYKLQQATERQKALYQELDKVKAAPPAIAPTVPSGAAAPAGGTPAAANPAAGVRSVTTPSSDQATPGESKAYDAAVNLVIKDKQYDKAVPAFQTFIAQYPQSTYVPNAHYWLGQLLFNQGDRESAKTHFLTVAQKYKDSAKRPDAILKLGMISQFEGDNEKADKFFQLVIAQYPNSSSAQLAKKAMGSR